MTQDSQSVIAAVQTLPGFRPGEDRRIVKAFKGEDGETYFDTLGKNGRERHRIILAPGERVKVEQVTIPYSE